MIEPRNHWIKTLGLIIILIGGLFFFLFLMNVRAQLKWGAPNHFLLPYIAAFCAVTGVGLLKLKRWAVLLSFLPGLLVAFLYLYLMYTREEDYVPIPWAFLNYLFIILLLMVPAWALRSWKELRW